MFLKNLKIENNGTIIRDISFYKGINLIVDETKTLNKTESGNDVGKTTVLRLIDYCLGGSGENIYKDTEFKNKANTHIENFLKNNNIIITLTLKENLDDPISREIVIRRNFLTYSKKIQEIDGIKIPTNEYDKTLKELIFKTKVEKPTFKQIISKNIRDEKNKLVNTVKVLNPYTTKEEYEALFLFWLGIDTDSSNRKEKLNRDRKLEEKLQERLRKESNLSQIIQSLLIVDRAINELKRKKDAFDVNENFNEELTLLNNVKSEINKTSIQVSRLELRKELIDESKKDLEKDLADIDTTQIKNLYMTAKAFINNIHKTFEDTLAFHNEMIAEKIKYITEELPTLELGITQAKRNLTMLLLQEANLSDKLKKTGATEELQSIISELNSFYEKKGTFEEQKRLWEASNEKLKSTNSELETINKGIFSKDDLIQKRVAEFNIFFSDISNRLYGEHFVLSPEKKENIYELNITNIQGNLGTGKKKGQMVSFDFAYIKFADALDIPCLHFILQDQIENVHDNQISNILNEIATEVNCQYILPVLRDKLPSNINVSQYEILSLSQSEKLFKIS